MLSDKIAEHLADLRSDLYFDEEEGTGFILSLIREEVEKIENPHMEG